MIKSEKDIIDEQAVTWVARSLSGDFSKDEELSMQAWLNKDQRHHEAFEAYMHVANCASIAADSAAEAALENDLAQFAEQQASRRSWLVAMPAIAASVAGFAVFITVMMGAGDNYTTYATGRGETEEVSLADGTVIALNTETEIQVLIDSRRRDIQFIKGEAMFDVARDPTRRFVVTSSAAKTSVLGTRFNIHEKTNETVVSVLSGVVDVDTPQSIESTVTLIAGQEVAINAGHGEREVRPFEPAAVTAWRRGLAYHANQPLSAVVADLNRYFTTEIVIGDSVLNDIPVTGGFDTQDQAVAVESLSIALSLRAERQGATRIILYKDE